jgi:TonB-dependent receptor
MKIRPFASIPSFSSTLAARFVLTLLVMFAAVAVAQTGKGAIAGHVTDSAGAVLQGAKVDLEPKAASVTTDNQGEFFITDLNAGSYSLTVSYVGFAPTTTKVNVTAGQTTRANLVLRVASKVEEITVTAERVHGEAEAINRELASDNILQVLPVEVITSLPNTNIADALGRLPSVTLERDEGEGKYVQIRGTQPAWSNVTINGMEVPSPEGSVRQIKLDTVPANLVESVEINKTLSANQDGDAIGGSVNLVTKQAEDRPTLYINGLGGYTPIIGGRSLYEIDSTIGKRFGANKKLGVLIGASYDWNGRGIDDVEPSPTTVQCDPGPTGCLSPSSTAPYYPTYKGEDIREYRYYRSRYGAAGSIDYKLGEISGLFIRGIYSHFNNFGDRWVYSPSFGTPAGNTGTINNGDGNMSFNSQIRRPVDIIGGVDAGGKHVFTKWTIAYDFSLARSSEEDHGYASANFAPLATSPLNVIPFALDTRDPNTPKLVPQGGVNIYDPTQYYIAGPAGTGAMDVSRTYSPQLNLQVGSYAARNYEWGGHFGTFEFGFKFRNAHKFQDSVDNYYDGIDPNNPPANLSSYQMTNFLGTFSNPNYYNHAYSLGPLTDYGKIRAFFNANQGPSASAFYCQSVNLSTSALLPFDCSVTQQSTIPNNYDLVEHVTAGYAMNSINFGKFRLITGLRLEATTENVSGLKLYFDSNGNTCTPGDTDPVCAGVTNPIAPVVQNSSYLDPLPSVQLRYQLPHDAAIRLAYGRGIARPNFADLPPYFNHNGPNMEVDIGNPTLKPTHANNYDILYEQYLKPLGLIQAGFFYKQLSDPIYEGVRALITPSVATQFNIPTNPYVTQGWDLVRPVNGASARLYGFEIAYQQHLTFLPSGLRGIGISANYSYTNSATDGVPNRSDKPALQRQAPNTWNISPTYDFKRISARLGLSYNGANIFQYNYSDLNSNGSPNRQPLGIKGPNGDVYLYSHLQVDAQAAFRLYRGLQFIFAGLNLTNEVFGFYQGSPQYPIQREYYKTSYMFGLRYTLSNEPH